MAKSAYEKMFEDGTAFKPIKIDQPSPENPGGGFGGGGDPDRPLENPGGRFGDGGPDRPPEVDYSLFDEHMKERVNEKIEAKKAAVGNEPRPALPSPPQAGGDRIVRLERRIELLEQALGLVMETQTKLMRG